MKELVKPLVLIVLIFGCQQEKFNDKQFRDENNKVIKSERFGNIPALFEQTVFQEDDDLTEIYDEVSNLRIADNIHVIESNEEIRIVEIYPTGTSPTDWLNIQLEIYESIPNLAELEIRLMSKDLNGVPTPFNLGQGSEGRSIFIYGNEARGAQGKVIRIIGESETSIIGGFEYLSVGLKNVRSLLSWDRELIEIKNIRFFGSEIVTAGGGSLPIPENIRIENCQFKDYDGIRCMGFFGTTESFVLKDCTIKNTNIAFEIFNDNPNTLIEDNTIINSGGGIVIGNNASGNYTVRDNYIDVVEKSIPLLWAGIGIITRENTQINVYDNRIWAEGDYHIGIWLLSGGAKAESILSNANVQDNEIYVNSNFAAAIDITAIEYEITDNCISNNTIKGTAGFEFATYNFNAEKINNITYSNNNAIDFNSTCLGYDKNNQPIGCLDILLDEFTHDLQYCGDVDKLIEDRGYNNTFTENDDACLNCSAD